MDFKREWRRNKKVFAAILTIAVVPILIAKKTGITACTGAFPTPTELIETGPNLPTITISKKPSNV